MVKISKEMLNEVLKYITEDNFKYGLIFKITYIYGRNIGEVLKLRKMDVDLKHNTLDFNLPTESVSFMLHKSIYEDLVKYVDYKDLNDNDYIFIKDDTKINMYSKKLNLYLRSFINELNRSVLSWHCPVLVNRDFKNLRGQHLFIDGADIKTINQLYRNKNIQSTKDNIDYKELLDKRFPCNSLKKVFYDYTDLDVFVDAKFKNTELFTICDDKDTLVLEYDYDTNVVNLLGDNNSDLYATVSSLDYNVFFDKLKDLDTGHYRYFEGLKIIKN